MLATMAASQKPSLLWSWSLCRDQNSPPHSAHLHRWYSSFLGIEKFYHSHLLKIFTPHLSATCSAEKLLNFSSYLPRSPAPISCRTLCVWLSLVLLSVLLSVRSLDWGSSPQMLHQKGQPPLGPPTHHARHAAHVGEMGELKNGDISVQKYF